MFSLLERKVEADLGERRRREEGEGRVAFAARLMPVVGLEKSRGGPKTKSPRPFTVTTVRHPFGHVVSAYYNVLGKRKFTHLVAALDLGQDA